MPSAVIAGNPAKLIKAHDLTFRQWVRVNSGAPEQDQLGMIHANEGS
jgi:hypothetical protein